MEATDLSCYRYADAGHSCAHKYLMPAVRNVLESVPGRRIFEIGCGNGAMAAHLASLGYKLVGVDPSTTGIGYAKRAYPSLRLEQGSAYGPLAERFGRFPIVLRLEIVEHIFRPREFAQTCFDLLEPGGNLLLSTPYHGYLKNVAVAILGRFDRHVDPLWDGGHIKFWSERTLGALLDEAGFSTVKFLRVGRVRPLAKSMIAVARHP